MEAVSGLMVSAVMWIGGGVFALVVGMVTYFVWLNQSQMKGM